MSEENKLPEENVDAKVEEQAEAAAETEEKVEEAPAATEEKTEQPAAEAAEEKAEPAEPRSCCSKTGNQINFWKLATVFLLLAWAVQNWRITQAEEEAKKQLPFYRQALSSPTNEDNVTMMDEVGQQLAEAQEYVACSPRGIAPSLDDMYESLSYKMFIPGLKDYKVNYEVKGDVLTVTGTVKVAKKEKNAEGALIAESNSQFKSEVKLPCAIKTDKIKVEKTDNVLTIVMPKVKPTSPESEAPKAACCPGTELKAKAPAKAPAKEAAPAKK